MPFLGGPEVRRADESLPVKVGISFEGPGCEGASAGVGEDGAGASSEPGAPFAASSNNQAMKLGSRENVRGAQKGALL